MRAPESVSNAPRGDRARGQQAVLLLDLEAQPRAVAREPQQARGIVDEALLVQYPQAPGLEVLKRVRRRAQLARLGPPRATAIALTVKSRRARSSSSVPGATSGSAPGAG